MTRKLLVRDSRGERELLLVGTMEVGRDPRCDISDPDPLLSRRHAELIVSGDAVRLRNLQSRNGVQVNGLNVSEALLRPGDVVRIASLTIQLVADREEESPAAATAVDDDDDSTVLVPPPQNRRPTAAGHQSTAPAPAVVAEDDDDATRIVIPPAAAGTAPSRGRRDAVRRPVSAVRTAPATPVPTFRNPRTAWATRVTLRTVFLAVGVFLLSAVPLSIWQSRVFDRAAVSRATAVAQRLAAEAVADPAGLEDVTAAVGREPGVLSVRLLDTDGRVLAPSSRATEAYARIPGVQLRGVDVVRARSGWNGDLIEAVAPVRSPRTGQTGVAWVTIRPAALPEAGAGALVILAPILLVTLCAGFFVAVGIRRITTDGLKTLNEQIELVLSGQLPAVIDPIKSRPVRDLADTFNYLTARLRAASESQEQKAAQPVPPPVTPAVSAAPSTGATLVADATFRITEATAGCLDVLGVKPNALIGRHLLDAVPEGTIADAVLSCIGDVSSSGSARKEVPGFPLTVSVTRTSGDGPVTISFIRPEVVVRA